MFSGAMKPIFTPREWKVTVHLEISKTSALQHTAHGGNDTGKGSKDPTIKYSSRYSSLALENDICI